MVIDDCTLVLNQNYEPLNVCGSRRAFVLSKHFGKAEVLAEGRHAIRGVSASFPVPAVIRLHQMVRRLRPRIRLTRREIFARNGYRCMYCGVRTNELTIDHVMPRDRDSCHEWENIVAACRECNYSNGGRTPTEAHMRLLQ